MSSKEYLEELEERLKNLLLFCLLTRKEFFRAVIMVMATMLTL